MSAKGSRYWRCKRQRDKIVCGTLNLKTKRKCTRCGQPRPAVRKTKAALALADFDYEAWVAKFGARCQICGAKPKPGRRLHRDHDHRTDLARGLLDFRCNRALPPWMTPEWLRAAADYLELAPERRKIVAGEPCDRVGDVAAALARARTGEASRPSGPVNRHTKE